MKVNEIGLDETSDVEYTVALTSEEMNWVRAYEYIRNNLPERYIEQMDEFVSYALRYGQVEDDKDDGVDNDDAVKAYLKSMINGVYGADADKTVHPDEDCVLPGCDRYGGNDTYLRIRKVLGHKGAFDFCMGNVIKLVDRWEKKGDPAQNLEKLRDYSAQALVEWRLWNEKLS